ncbi:YcnI family protein [Actinoplanes sp. NPDC051411]|uniref:YcnI family copper-binding membrane protein n=1 Tax=Actinoplanes sp. NPDC051411 TaxID=3155522 RepID=UPI00341BA26C
MNRSLLGRIGVVTAGAAALVLAIAGPASAHVTVNPNTAAQGAYTKVSFRVPTESDTASTTKLQVNLPTDTPIASVSTKPVVGWTVATVKSKLATPIKSDDGDITEAVTQITWTASKGAEIKPGEFQEFDVSLGPLPTTANQIIFKALQTYSDGTIVRWIDEPTTDGSEPDHPAPVLKLTAAAAAPAAAPATTTVAQTSASPAKSSNSGLGWGIAALVVAVIALLLGLAAFRRAGAGAASTGAGSGTAA